MTRMPSIRIAAFMAFVLAMVLGACKPPPSPVPPRPGYHKPAPADTVTFRVVSPCALKDDCGSDVQAIAVRPSTPIRWINETQDEVVIFFEPSKIVGRDHIYLPSGKSYVTTTNGSEFSGPEFRVIVYCAGIQGPTPPIKECPPPPDPCP